MNSCGCERAHWSNRIRQPPIVFWKVKKLILTKICLDLKWCSIKAMSDFIAQQLHGRLKPSLMTNT